MIDEKKLLDIATKAAERFADSGRSHAGFMKCESPIEKLMFVALSLCGVGRDVSIEQQVEIGEYRVDFELTAMLVGGEFLRVVVECDGHDFHERTKAQARRDKSRHRALVARGYAVLHFTGSEIWADAEACAEEVYDYIEGVQVDAMWAKDKHNVVMS